MAVEHPYEVVYSNCYRFHLVKRLRLVLSRRALRALFHTSFLPLLSRECLNIHAEALDRSRINKDVIRQKEM